MIPMFHMSFKPEVPQELSRDAASTPASSRDVVEETTSIASILRSSETSKSLSTPTKKVSWSKDTEPHRFVVPPQSMREVEKPKATKQEPVIDDEFQKILDEGKNSSQGSAFSPSGMGVSLLSAMSFK